MNRIKLLLIRVLSVSFIILPLILCSFTEDYLIFLKNPGKYNFLSLNEILTESGIAPKKKPPAETILPVQTYNPVVKPQIPEQNVSINVPENNDFSINLLQGSNMIVLKSIKGDSTYNASGSDPQKGLFMFHSAENDTKISFQAVNPDGSAIKNIYYYVLIIKNTILPSSSYSISNNQNNTENSQLSQTQPQQEESTNSNRQSGTFNPSTADSLPDSEAEVLLKNVISSSIYTSTDKENALYKLLDIELKEGSFSNASANIETISDIYKKSLYTARLDSCRKNYNDALKNYFLAFPGDLDTMTNAVLESEGTIAMIGTIDTASLESLISQTKKLSGTNDFYGESIINIAGLYQYIPDIYTSKNLLDSIIKGNFSDRIKNKAVDAENKLDNDFLNYK